MARSCRLSQAWPGRQATNGSTSSRASWSISPAARSSMRFGATLTRRRKHFATVLEAAKLRVLDTIMASEFNVLAQLIGRIAAGHYSTRDYLPSDRLREALRLYILDVSRFYRTYVTAAGPAEADRGMITAKPSAMPRRRWQGTDAEIFGFLEDVLTLDLIRDGLS